MKARNRRRHPGVIPRITTASLAWVLHHPQPLLAAALLATVGWTLCWYVTRCDAFQVERVEFPPGVTLTLKTPVVGTNIWQIDVHQLAEELSRQQPTLKEIRVIRELPSTIRVLALPRVPVAQIRLDAARSVKAAAGNAPQTGQWYPVDRAGFILPDGTGMPNDRLIRIVGVERSTVLNLERVNTAEPLQLGLRLVQQLRRAPALVSRRLTEINVADAQQLRFVLDDDTEVRCGSEQELAAQLRRLQHALRMVATHGLSAQYIDVRFQEPVVGPRTMTAG